MKPAMKRALATSLLALAFANPASASEASSIYDACQNRMDFYWEMLKARFDGKPEQRMLAQTRGTFTGSDRKIAIGIVKTVYDAPKHQIATKEARRKTLDRMYRQCLNGNW